MIASLIRTLAIDVREGNLRGDSLLEQLSEARATSKNGGAGGGNPSPINEAAVELWARIESRIHDDCVDWCGYAPAGPTKALLAFGIAFFADQATGSVPPEQETAAAARLQGYVDDIAALLDPPKMIPIRGHACPECGESRVKVGRGILATEQPALIAIPNPLSISCRFCGAFAGGGAGIRQNVHEVVAFALRAGAKVNELQIADALRGVA